MHLAVMAGKFVQQDVREWCPLTTFIDRGRSYGIF